MKPEKKARKAFVKPEVKKHQAIASIAGSGSGADCLYSSNTVGGVYYH